VQYDAQMYAAVNTTLYRYFAIVGGVYQVGSSVMAAVLTFLVRKRRPSFGWTLTGVCCLRGIPISTGVDTVGLDAAAQPVGVWTCGGIHRAARRVLRARALGACRNAAEPATRGRRAGEVSNSPRIIQSPAEGRHNACARRALRQLHVEVSTH
jgi:hypothetical protein